LQNDIQIGASDAEVPSVWIGFGVGLVMDGKSKSGHGRKSTEIFEEIMILYIYYIDVFPSIFPRWNLEAFRYGGPAG